MTPLFYKKIGYKFKDPALIVQALTHSSVAYESDGAVIDNQRLEFLGDAVLELVISKRLYELFPKFPEGRLTKLRATLVNGKALTRYALDMELGDDLVLGKGEESSGGRKRESNLANAFEAVIGAIYLDGGLKASEKFVLSHLETAIEAVQNSPFEINPKGQLQEMVQGTIGVTPRYEVVGESGVEHSKIFEARVVWQDQEWGRGTGSSKKLAETAAAEAALSQVRGGKN